MHKSESWIRHRTSVCAVGCDNRGDSRSAKLWGLQAGRSRGQGSSPKGWL